MFSSLIFNQAKSCLKNSKYDFITLIFLCAFAEKIEVSRFRSKVAKFEAKYF